MAKKNGFEVFTQSNHFPLLHKRIAEAAAQHIADTAEELESELSVSGWVAGMPISTEIGHMQATIRIGNRKKFYSGFLEFGTVDQAPQPIVVPTAERHKDQFIKKAKSFERQLRFT